jgi:23S rRNA U2552 (ribose-2'-O)-methylase RlmE/FtsJ
VLVPKRRHLTLLVNMLRVTRNPVDAYRGVRIGRLAIRNRAAQKLSEVGPFFAAFGRPQTVVEIGAGRGGMLAAYSAAAAGDATIVSVDLEGGPFGSGVSDAELRTRANARPGQTLHLVRGDSRDPEIYERVHGLVPDGVDVLMIDGDHSYEGVSSDFRMYSQLVKPGGIVAFHDILPHSVWTDCQVDRLWAELPVDGRQEITSPRERAAGGTWGGIGIVSWRYGGPDPIQSRAKEA